MAKPRSWNDIPENEIYAAVAEMKADLFQLKCEYKFAKKIEQPHRLRTIRRDIARALTEVQRRKIDAYITSVEKALAKT